MSATAPLGGWTQRQVISATATPTAVAAAKQAFGIASAALTRRGDEMPPISDVPFIQGETLTAVIEMGQASWPVAGMERQPLKKLAVDQDGHSIGGSLVEASSGLLDAFRLAERPTRQRPHRS